MTHNLLTLHFGAHTLLLDSHLTLTDIHEYPATPGNVFGGYTETITDLLPWTVVGVLLLIAAVGILSLRNTLRDINLNTRRDWAMSPYKGALPTAYKAASTKAAVAQVQAEIARNKVPFNPAEVHDWQ